MADKEMLSGLIMEGTRIDGKLTFRNKMRFDGELNGEIVSKEMLIVGKNAQIQADIKVGQMIVMGVVKGTITECEQLEIQEGGSVIADINVKSLDIKPGAIFEGKCAMISDSSGG